MTGGIEKKTYIFSPLFFKKKTSHTKNKTQKKRKRGIFGFFSKNEMSKQKKDDEDITVGELKKKNATTPRRHKAQRAVSTVVRKPRKTSTAEPSCDSLIVQAPNPVTVLQPKKEPRTKRLKNQGTTPTTAVVGAATGSLFLAESIQAKKRMHIITNEDTRCNSTRSAHSVTNYDPQSGNVLQVITHVKEEVLATNSTKSEMVWEEELVVRKKQLATLRATPIDEAKAMSRTFQYYVQRVRKEIMHFQEWTAYYYNCCNEEEDSRWTNPDVIMRFLFGISSRWSQDYAWQHERNRVLLVPECKQQKEEEGSFFEQKEQQDGLSLSGDECPWLACCWSMEEMLAICCDDTTQYVRDYMCNPINSESSVQTRIDTPMFLMSNLVMTAYSTGLLLCEHIPELKRLIRPKVLEDTQKLYFPTFASFEGSDNQVFQLKLSYNFFAVAKEEQEQLKVTRRVMKSQPLCGTCFLVDANMECDGPLVQLISNSYIKSSCFQVFERLGLQRPRSSETYDDSAQELERFLIEQKIN